MRKIIEGFYGLKGNENRIFGKTKDLNEEENQLIESYNYIYANLKNIDAQKGYSTNSLNTINVSDSIYSYSSRLLNDRLLFTKHENVLSAEGNYLETLHFLSLPLDIPCRIYQFNSLETFKTSDWSSLYFAQTANVELDEIRSIPEKVETLGFNGNAQKARIIELLDYIIYADKNKKTLYVCYEMNEINRFHEDFFMALSLLPVALCNRLSFITCYGGEPTNQFSIIGVPIKYTEIADAGFSKAGLVYNYSSSSIVTDEAEITNNYLHRVLETIKDESEMDRYQRFAVDSYKDNLSLEGFLNYVQLYSLLNSPFRLIQNQEYSLVDSFNKEIALLTVNINNIERVEQSVFNDVVLFTLNKQSGTLCQLSNFQVLGSLPLKTIALLESLYEITSLKPLKDTVKDVLYNFLFEFDNSNEVSNANHADLIYRALNSEKIGQELIRYIASNQGRYNNCNSLINSLNSQKCQVLYYSQVYRYYFDNYNADSSLHVHIVDILLRLSNIINIKELGKLIIRDKENEELLRRSFDVLCKFLVQNKDKQIEKELDEFVLGQIDNNAFLTICALETIRPESAIESQQRPILDLKSLILDHIIKEDEVDSFTKICKYIDAVQPFKDNLFVYDEIKNRLVSKHLNKEVAFSIDALLVNKIDQKVLDYFTAIEELLSDRYEVVPQAILQSIRFKRNEVNGDSDKVIKENELSLFRVGFVVRAVELLPAKESRPIIYKFIGEEKAKPIIDEEKQLSSEDYAREVGKLSEEYLNDDNNSIEDRRHFVKTIFEAQNKKRFATFVLTVADYLLNVLLFGGITLGLSLIVSFILCFNVVGDIYLTPYIIISIALACISALLIFITLKKKWRKDAYLISIIITLILMVFGLGLCTLIALLTGGVY